MFTAKLGEKYCNNLPIGKPLKIICRFGREYVRKVEGWSSNYNQKGELLAEANALLVDMPNSSDLKEMGESGWKV